MLGRGQLPELRHSDETLDAHSRRHFTEPERLPVGAIIQHLKLHGEQLDADIAEALQLPLEQVRADMRELSAKGAVMMCFVTRYRDKKKIEGWACRVAGFIPPAAPGRKPGSPQS